MEIPPFPDPLVVAHQRGKRDRLVAGVSALTQMTTWAALAATGVTTGLLAHAAQVQDRLTAQARLNQAQAPLVAPVVVRRRPVRTVVVRVPAAVRRSATRVSHVSRAPQPRVTRTATVYRAPRPSAPAPTKKAAATTTSGS